jgi:hypothetical protein
MNVNAIVDCDVWMCVNGCVCMKAANQVKTYPAMVTHASPPPPTHSLTHPQKH